MDEDDDDAWLDFEERKAVFEAAVRIFIHRFDRKEASPAAVKSCVALAESLALESGLIDPENLAEIDDDDADDGEEGDDGGEEDDAPIGAAPPRRRGRRRH